MRYFNTSLAKSHSGCPLSHLWSTGNSNWDPICLILKICSHLTAVLQSLAVRYFKYEAKLCGSQLSNCVMRFFQGLLSPDVEWWVTAGRFLFSFLFSFSIHSFISSLFHNDIYFIFSFIYLSQFWFYIKQRLNKL